MSKLKLSFTDRVGCRNISTPFVAYIGNCKLQFNRIAEERFFISKKRNFYLAYDRKDILHKNLYLFPICIDDEKTFPIQQSRFPYIDCPELSRYFRSNDKIFFSIERFQYQSLDGFKLTKL